MWMLALGGFAWMAAMIMLSDDWAPILAIPGSAAWFIGTIGVVAEHISITVH